MLSLLISLLQFLYKFCRLVHGFISVLLPNYCDISNSFRSFTLLKALAKSNGIIFSLSPLRARKSDNYCYRDSWKSDNFRERAIKKRKELIPKRMQRGLRVITLQGAIEKSPILLSQY